MWLRLRQRQPLLCDKRFYTKPKNLHLTRAMTSVHHGSTDFPVQSFLNPFTEPGRGIGGEQMVNVIRRLWSEEAGQDIAEYAVMLAVILVLVVGTVQLIGSNANNAFSSVASSLQ